MSSIEPHSPHSGRGPEPDRGLSSGISHPTSVSMRLARRARWLAVVPLIAALLLGVGLVAQWVSEDLRAAAFASSLGMRGNDLVRDAVAFPAALWPTIIRSVPIFVFGGTMYLLFRLFRRLSVGFVLDQMNAKLVSRAGIGFVIFAGTAVLSNTLTTLLLSLHNPPGERILSIGFTTSDIGAFAAGFALFGLGSVLGEAARVADDNASIV
ncbi:MAG: hypothetical protein AAGH43_11695 [Pseudomonadota bacterium]